MLPSTARKPPRVSGLGVPSPLPSLPEHILAQGCLMWGEGPREEKKKRGRSVDKEEILVNAAFANILVMKT